MTDWSESWKDWKVVQKLLKVVRKCTFQRHITIIKLEQGDDKKYKAF